MFFWFLEAELARALLPTERAAPRRLHPGRARRRALTVGTAR
jgi:hypothetical protein